MPPHGSREHCCGCQHSPVAVVEPTARLRLGELGDELRGAHRDLEGEWRIRELSAW